MPSLQQINSFKDCPSSGLGRNITGSDILQKHSINSLLEQNDLMNRNGLVTPGVDNEIGFTDIFGRSTPASMTGTGHGASTPITKSGPFGLFNSIESNPTSKAFEHFNFDNFQSMNNRGYQRNLSCDLSATSSNSPLPASSLNLSKGTFLGSPPSYFGHDLSNHCSMSSGSTLGSPIEQNTFFGGSLSRSNSPILDGSGGCNSNHDSGSPPYESSNINNIMNFLSMGYPQANQQQHQQQQHYISPEFQSLQTLQTLHMLQQQAIQKKFQMPFQQFLQQQFLQSCSQNNSKNWQQQNHQSQNSAIDSSLDRVAKFHRTSAALYDPTCTWSGVLPPRSHRFITYSPKVFLGGIPWDISEQSLMQIFKPFGQIRVEWPGKEQNAAQPKGYVYIIFETEKQVKCLLQACSIQDTFTSNNHSSTSSIPSSCSSISSNSGNYYYKISSKRIKAKEVEVIPWIIGDSNYVKSTSQKLDPTKTVFVGALHGKLTAEGLAKIMNDLFGGVVYAGIDTDKYKYPIGSGRVTFNSTRSYMRAVSAAFIEIKTSKFTKKVQVDPYLEDSLCSMCGVQHGPYYCRESACFRYFCRQCWQMRHGNDVFLRNHKPLTRNSKSQQIIGVGPQSSNGQQSFHSQMNDNSTQNDRNTPSSPVGSLNSMLNPLSYGLN